MNTTNKKQQHTGTPPPDDGDAQKPDEASQAQPNDAARTDDASPACSTEMQDAVQAALGLDDDDASPVSQNLGVLSDYCLTPDDGELEAVRVRQTVARRPAHDEWFMVSARRDHTVDLLVLESSRDRAPYLVSKTVRASIRANLKQKRAVVCANRHGDIFVWLVTLPSTNGSQSPWIVSAHRAVELAMTNWVRIITNMRVGMYDLERWPKASTDGPKWPAGKIDELLLSAFEGRIIASVDHPVVRELKGEV